MHISKCNKISADTAGKYLLTCSDDKTARLWETSTGNLLKTLRIPLDKDSINAGKIFAASLSPDGKWAAVGGWTKTATDLNFCVYIFNTQSGNILRRITGFDNVIKDLEFSPDGSKIAAGLGGTKGVRIIDTVGWKNNRLEGFKYSNEVYNLAFKPDGGLITVSFDGKIRLYNNHFDTLAEKSGLEGKKISSLAINPTGTLVAVGYFDTSVVEVRNTVDLSPLYYQGFKDKNESELDILSFSADGSKLFGGGKFYKINSNSSQKFVVRCWSDSGRGSFTDFPVMNNIITDMKPLRDGSIAVTGSFPDIAVINADNTLKKWQNSAENNDYRDRNKSHFRINDDGSKIGFTPLEQAPYIFDILNRKLAADTSKDPPYTDSVAGTVVRDWRSSRKTSINGKRFPLKVNENCRSVDITADGRQIVLGADLSLYFYDNKAESILRTILPSEAYAVNISGNGKTVAAALSDGTIRWYSMKDGKELLALYILSEKKSWVLFTPSGYYDASPGAEDFLGWHINNGPDKEADFFPASRFREVFYRPDIIDSIFKSYDENKAIKSINLSEGKPENLEKKIDITQKLPPVIRIISPENYSFVSTDTVSITFNISGPANAPVKKIKVLKNGRPYLQDSLVNIDSVQKINVSIPREDCTFTLLATNDNGASPEANLSIKWKEPEIPTDQVPSDILKAVVADTIKATVTDTDTIKAAVTDTVNVVVADTVKTVPEDSVQSVPEESVKKVVEKPNLYILSIGVSDYDNDNYDLTFAAKDAKDFVSVMKKQKDIFYTDVIDSTITDKQASKNNILRGLDWILNSTGENDIAMLFFSGHGYSDSKTYYMLPVDANINELRVTCLNFADIKQTQASIKGKVIVFIDACHSGDLMSKGINGLVNIMTSTDDGQAGAITFTSSTGKEESLEKAELGNGAFTKALIDGLNASQIADKKKNITYMALGLYISQQVPELTDDQQHPTMVPSPNTPNFPIGTKK